MTIPRTLRIAAVMAWAGVTLAWCTLSPGLSADPSPWRILIVGAFLAIGPGYAVVLLFRVADPLLSIVLSIGISCTLLVLTAQVSLYAGVWSPMGTLIFIVYLTAGVCILALRPSARESGTRRSAGTPEAANPGSPTGREGWR